MATEFVVALGDSGRKIDLNNGYVYGPDGSQIAKWSPKHSTTKEADVQTMCADLAYSESRLALRRAYRSRLTGDLVQRVVLDGKGTVEGERQVLMDLGVGDVHLPAAEPGIAMGYRNFTPVADMASPPLLTTKQANKYYIFDPKDAYQLAAPTVGAPGGQPNEVSPRLSSQPFYTTEYSLGAFVPTEIDAAADAPLRIRQAALKRVLNILMMRREGRVANMLQTSGNWNSNNVATLGAGYQWDGGASSDPIKDLQTRMEASLGEVTAIIMAEPTWHAFQRNPNVQKYFQYKSGVAPLPNSASMSAILELPPIYVARMKYFAPSGSATTFVWGTSVVLVRQPEQMPPVTQDDAATSYTFRWNVSAAADVQNQVRMQAQGFGTSGPFCVREFFNQVRGSMGGTQLVCVHWDYEAMTSGYVGGLIVGAYQ